MFRILDALDRVKFGGGVTVSRADVLMPSELTVMVEVPAAIPVANPVALMVAIAALLLANVRGAAAMELPYWSLGAAVNCWVTPTCTDAACGVNVIEDKEGDASLVEAGEGLPPQLTHKRRMRAIETRDISFHFFLMIVRTHMICNILAAPYLKEQCNRHASFRIGPGWKLPRPGRC
jgi:hypothetical protein